MSDDIAIKVESVSKTFKLPHEKQSSLKGMFVNLFNGKRSYEKQKVLNDISFEIKKGEFFGIVGRNGSGKSTLLKLLAGIYEPNSGAIDVRGKLTPFIELGVGFNPELTGRENVFLNGALLGFNRREMTAMYQEIVDFAEIEKFMDQKLKNYSSGMQVRLAFSIAIRAQGDILLLDEVLAVGDAAFQQKCFNYFEELKQQQKTVIFVSHDMGSVRRFCSRAIYVKDGVLIHDGTSAEVADIYMADNIKHEEEEIEASSKESRSPGYSICAQIKDRHQKEIGIEFTHTSSPDGSLYIAFSVIKDGVSVAELTTPKDLLISGSGKVNYTLDISHFNPGVYQISTVLCRRANRELVSIGMKKPKFIIKGNDITRGGAIKLDHNWTMAEHTNTQ